MSAINHFIGESIKKAQIDEYLQRELERSGYGGVDITTTPLGTHIVIHAMRPGLVIGRGGNTIKVLSKTLEERFGVPNPQISVTEIEFPELNSYIMASRIASALRRGVHFRRVGFWALNQIMRAGALGAEIGISGKLRTDRSRTEKFREGYIPKSGDHAVKYLRKASIAVQLKQGIFGVKVCIMPPGITLPDRIEIVTKRVEETEVTTGSAIPEEQMSDFEEEEV
ncbi:MAG: 30S ribosomal protein S3 [Candidatus Bathyarchaeia archaeon]